jgi:hypothetical protein
MFQFQSFVVVNLQNYFSHLFSCMFLFAVDCLFQVLYYTHDSFVMSATDNDQDPIRHLLHVMYEILSSMHLDPFPCS